MTGNIGYINWELGQVTGSVCKKLTKAPCEEIPLIMQTGQFFGKRCSPSKNSAPHRLRRLQLLFDVGYKSRTGELLVQAAVKNCPEVINELDERLGDKIDVNAQFSGTTPLIAAVKHGSAQCVSMLLARQADPRVRDSDGKSAIDYAAQDLPATNKDEALRSRMLTIRRLIQDATKEKSSAPK